MRHKRLLFICILAASLALATQAWAAQSAPTDVEAAPGNGSAAVSFAAPSGTISSYTVRASDGTTATGTSSPIVVHNLKNGTAYTFTVTATNNLGQTSSLSSASNSVTPSNNAYAAYAGTWHETGMATGPDSLWGESCVQTQNGNGTFSMSCTDVNGIKTSYNNCQAWLFPYGMTATCNGQPVGDNFVCYGNTPGTVMSCTETINDNNGSSPYLVVAVKQGASYSNSDILNTSWYGEGLGIKSDGSGFWEQDISGPISIPGTGHLTGNATYSYEVKGSSVYLCLGTPWQTAGMFSIYESSDCSGKSINLYMDAGKSVFAGFNAVPPWVELGVFSRKAASYSTADLAGYWTGSDLSTDGKWERALFEVNADGSFIARVVVSDGKTRSNSGNFSFGSGGVVNLFCNGGANGANGCPGVQMVMDSSKSVMTMTKTTDSAENTYEMLILTKASSLWPNGVAFTGGWMGLDWLGNFNVNSAPWIYHQTLGWLYPYITGTSTESMWFYDPQWDGTGGWWWTSSSLYPWVYSTAEGWLYFDAKDSSPAARWFFNGAGKASTH